eukprot:CAMPEP_0198242190 /NCGR_PEP_ID=MMETSP1446-20131203/12301_1 /TAXON_ID=1461542 ORGANISM="Unidentified sp, Strain CCMP2111" /NCGR_SAMPLE_ID=MMETSP1446 /ASSEMBLY_ACC=CAM_ASM_001112 /LENGTH=43 /DNA_ID= /DNA_START= /DNA_END= /DNA_ORIENTATION=
MKSNVSHDRVGAEVSDVAPIMVVVMNACVLTCLMAAATLAFGV